MLPFKNGEANKAYKAAVIISIPYPGGECDTVCQRERPHQPRTFCRKPALQQSCHEAQAKVARDMQSEIMSLSPRVNKPAHIH